MERKIAQLTEMGVTRAAAKSALRTCKGDVEEAAMVVFDERHMAATSIPSDGEEPASSRSLEVAGTGKHTYSKGKGKQSAKLPVSRAILQSHTRMKKLLSPLLPIKTPDYDEDEDSHESEEDQEDLDIISNADGVSTRAASDAGSIDCTYLITRKVESRMIIPKIL